MPAITPLNVAFVAAFRGLERAQCLNEVGQIIHE